MRQTVRPLVAELVGVFMLVFVAGGAVIMGGYQEGAVSLGTLAAASGLAYAIAVTATMGISGGHINPAVTIGLWTIGRIESRKAALYVVAQLLGALLAAAALRWLMPAEAAQARQYGALSIAQDVSTASSRPS